MVDQSINVLFNELYDKTYTQTALFVTKRCDDPAQIADVLQEIYADVFAAITVKGLGYMKNPEAFVRHVAKKKLARYYGWKSRLRDWLPLFAVNQEIDDEYEVIPIALDDLPIDEQVEKKLLISEISELLAAKPADVQKIFMLHYSLDLPIRRIAEELKLSESTVKTKLYRTLNELRKIYRKDGILS